jgi:hypothetical protein
VEIGVKIELVERVVNLEEDLLGQVLGLVDAADELIGDVEYAPAVTALELFPGPVVAPKADSNQLVVFQLLIFLFRHFSGF